MKYTKKLWSMVKTIYTRSAEDCVNATAGNATLFMVISFFPFVMLLLASVKYMPFTREQVIDLFGFISPGALSDTVKRVINEVYARSGSFALSVTAISLFWAASTSIYSITVGLNRVYNHTETRNYAVLRLLSLFYTFVFIATIGICLGFLVFGGSIMDFLKTRSPFFERFDGILNLGAKAVAFGLILLIFCLLYTLLPNRRSRVDFELPGALFSVAGWYVFSFFYSIYIENFSNFSYIYGSITAVVLLVIWLYICVYMFFLGAEINQYAAENGWRKRQREAFSEKHLLRDAARLATEKAKKMVRITKNKKL